MATIKQVYDTTDNTVTITLNSLALGTSVLSSALDNSTDKFLAIELEMEITGVNAGNGGTVDLYLIRSNDNTNFSTTSELGNAQFIGSLTQNGTTLARKFFRVEQVPAYFKILAKNTDTTYALGSSGNSLSYRGVDLSNA